MVYNDGLFMNRYILQQIQFLLIEAEKFIHRLNSVKVGITDELFRQVVGALKKKMWVNK